MKDSATLTTIDRLCLLDGVPFGSDDFLDLDRAMAIFANYAEVTLREQVL
jgi:hypothetical protein